MKLLTITTIFALIMGLAGCTWLDNLHAAIFQQTNDTVKSVTDQYQKTKDSVNKKIDDVQDAVNKVNAAVDAVKKVGQ